MANVITVEKLRKLKACSEQVEKFQAEWPKGAEITLDNCRRAIDLGLDLEWLVSVLCPALVEKAYREDIAPTEKVYNEATAQAVFQVLQREESDD